MTILKKNRNTKTYKMIKIQTITYFWYEAYIGKVNYYDGCNWLFVFGMRDLVGSFLVI